MKIEKMFFGKNDRRILILAIGILYMMCSWTIFASQSRNYHCETCSKVISRSFLDQSIECQACLDKGKQSLMYPIIPVSFDSEATDVLIEEKHKGRLIYNAPFVQVCVPVISSVVKYALEKKVLDQYGGTRYAHHPLLNNEALINMGYRCVLGGMAYLSFMKQEHSYCYKTKNIPFFFMVGIFKALPWAVVQELVLYSRYMIPTSWQEKAKSILGDTGYELVARSTKELARVMMQSL